MDYLHNTRLRIEKYVYEQGINVALDNAEKSKPYKQIKKNIEKALNKQIHSIADDERILDTLIMMAKAAGDPLLSQVKVLLSKYPISDEIDLKTYLVYVGELGGQAAFDKIGINQIFGLKNQQVIDYFGDYSNLLLDSVDNTTKKWIANKIQEGKDNGLSPFQIQESLISDGEGMSAIRAERIVLTETAKAMTTIENEAAARAGMQIKIWRTSRDDRVDPICLDLEGKEATVKGAFPGGYEGPPAHVSCRCYEEWVIPDGWVVPDPVWLGA